MCGCFSEWCEWFGNVVIYLEVVSFLVILVWGYSVILVSDGMVLKQIKQVKIGDLFIICLKDGWVESEVKQIVMVKKMWVRKFLFIKLVE